MKLRFIAVYFSLCFCCSDVLAQRELTATTEQLISRYKANPQIGWSSVDSEPKHQPEAILNTLRKRGKDALEPLRKLRDDSRQNDAEGENWSLANDLALLTTIRRIEGKAPPLHIEVNTDGPIQSAVRKPARIPVKIMNHDPEREAVWFTFGGNYRSGRLSRWRIHVWDADGESLPVIERKHGIGGGVYGQGELEFGESDERVLDLASFVRIRSPGRYTAQILYHDSVTIADVTDHKDLDNLVLVSSEKLVLDVRAGPKIRIRLTGEEDEESESLILQLNRSKTVKMVGSEYGPRYHSFIAPDSAHGKLLQMGHTAVPALIRRLKHPDAEYKERAWILAILDSILHERYLSPTDFDGAIGDFRCQFPGGHCSSSGPISVEAQEKLVKEWITFAKSYIVVEKHH
ncbi:MAG: hypothetical protein AAGI63_13300 [Planctomycetota bacterium]